MERNGMQFDQYRTVNLTTRSFSYPAYYYMIACNRFYIQYMLPCCTLIACSDCWRSELLILLNSTKRRHVLFISFFLSGPSIRSLWILSLIQYSIWNFFSVLFFSFLWSCVGGYSRSKPTTHLRPSVIVRRRRRRRASDDDDHRTTTSDDDDDTTKRRRPASAACARARAPPAAGRAPSEIDSGEKLNVLSRVLWEF